MRADRSKRFESINRALFALAAAALLGWGLGAKNESLKLGVVDFEQAVTSTDAGRAVREELARNASRSQKPGRKIPGDVALVLGPRSDG